VWGLLLAAVAALVLDLPETALAAPGQVGPVDCPTGIHACVVHAKGMDACPLHRFCLDDDWNYNTDHVDHPCLHWTRWYFWGCDGGHSDLMFITDLRTDDYCYKWPNDNFPVGRGDIDLWDYLANGQAPDPPFGLVASSYINKTDKLVDVQSVVVIPGLHSGMWISTTGTAAGLKTLFTAQPLGRRGDRSSYVGNNNNDKAQWLHVRDGQSPTFPSSGCRQAG
jgi:hypothetical protein